MAINENKKERIIAYPPVGTKKRIDKIGEDHSKFVTRVTLKELKKVEKVINTPDLRK